MNNEGRGDFFTFGRVYFLYLYFLTSPAIGILFIISLIIAVAIPGGKIVICNLGYLLLGLILVAPIYIRYYIGKKQRSIERRYNLRFDGPYPFSDPPIPRRSYHELYQSWKLHYYAVNYFYCFGVFITIFVFIAGSHPFAAFFACFTSIFVGYSHLHFTRSHLQKRYGVTIADLEKNKNSKKILMPLPTDD